MRKLGGTLHIAQRSTQGAVQYPGFVYFVFRVCLQNLFKFKLLFKFMYIVCGVLFTLFTGFAFLSLVFYMHCSGICLHCFKISLHCLMGLFTLLTGFVYRVYRVCFQGRFVYIVYSFFTLFTGLVYIIYSVGLHCLLGLVKLFTGLVFLSFGAGFLNVVSGVCLHCL